MIRVLNLNLDLARNPKSQQIANPKI